MLELALRELGARYSSLVANRTKLGRHPGAPDARITLVLVAGCLDPILAGERTSGIWVPKIGWLDYADRG